MIDPVSNTLSEFKRALQEIYGDRLRGLYLYGSRARGEASPDSDLDVMVVLDRVEHYAGEIDRTGAAASELSLRHGISISRVFISERDWGERDTTFLTNARDEAVRV